MVEDSHFDPQEEDRLEILKKGVVIIRGATPGEQAAHLELAGFLAGEGFSSTVIIDEGSGNITIATGEKAKPAADCC